MIKKNHAIILTLILTALTSASAVEVPMRALKIIADSRTKDCGICRKDMKKQAFAIIDRHFYPGKILTMNKHEFWMKNSECSINEFVFKSYSKGDLYKTDPKYGKICFPLITYKFHIKKKHLIGVKITDYTSSKNLKLFKVSMSNRDAVNNRKIQIKIIPYDYGDGKSFIFYPKRNVIQIQCRIITNSG